MIPEGNSGIGNIFHLVRGVQLRLDTIWIVQLPMNTNTERTYKAPNMKRFLMLRACRLIWKIKVITPTNRERVPISALNAMDKPRQRSFPINAASANKIEAIGVKTSNPRRALSWFPGWTGVFRRDKEACRLGEERRFGLRFFSSDIGFLASPNQCLNKA